ncbi:MAG: N-acetylneuraminate synthase family protein [Acidobacteria bacterium]|nr:N-acetylneuraminate synthase family protein [Acidobacteriota bacterium]
MTTPLALGQKAIGNGAPTVVVAEIGINHGGDLEAAERLVRAAAAASADAVKFQTYHTANRVPSGSPLFPLLRRCELSYEAQTHLKLLAESLGIAFFSTPFDQECADFLDDLGVPAFKLASFDIVNRPLARHVLAKGRLVIASTGMASRSEVDAFVASAKAASAPLVLLHCISAYPTPDDAAHLRVIDTLRSLYSTPVGYSDHTLGIDVPVLAVAAGAVMLEKHFTLDRSLEGPDHALSADPAQLRALVERVRVVERILGSEALCCREVEKPIVPYRRFA